LLQSVTTDSGQILVAAGVPVGYRHAVLESRTAITDASGEAIVSGTLEGGEAVVTFRFPPEVDARFLVLRVGTNPTPPTARYTGPAYYHLSPLSQTPLAETEQGDHALNRLAYGPSLADLDTVRTLGVGGYIEQQLQPGTIDDASNARLVAAETNLFELYQPRIDTMLVRVGEVWRYSKGIQAPPATWATRDFDDSAWLEGPTGIGYGDDDDATILDDMEGTTTQPGYLSVYTRRAFTVADPATVGTLLLRIDFDDGFAAYINGEPVARQNVTGTPPAYDSVASATHEAGTPVEFDLSAYKGLLQSGRNVLAIEVHNRTLDSSDLSLIPELIARTQLAIPPIKRIRGLTQLQQLVHTRGVHARRQLQTVLAEFWLNHFTTDGDKVASYFDDLVNSDAADAMSTEQALAEAAQVGYESYQFFTDNALGHFGDLLLYSASSPSMLIYLDSVLNVKGNANENYAREILELFGFGVDNRYTQRDIEELARCFTGWTLRKTWPQERPAFPASARTPLTAESVLFSDEAMLPLGPGWKYFKGRQEPSPDTNGAPTLAWTLGAFDDASWLDGSTGIGYGDDDDATVLTDMRSSYYSVYLRRPFVLPDGVAPDRLLLTVGYDDGFVAYLNGQEIARSESMADAASPPRYNSASPGSHEATLGTDAFSLKPFLHLLRAAPETNWLAIQVHNATLSSSDLSILPQLVQRSLLPGSIENGDPNGTWVFRFNPNQHDTSAKTLFSGTAYQINIPAGRTSADGVHDAIDVIDAMANHPSTREFICLKLINRFVSDDINLISYHNGTAPDGLRQLLDDAMSAWTSTSPPGHIETVLRAILRPQTRDGFFWSQSAARSKIKTPVEFINSTLRALDASVTGASLPAVNSTLGMDLFTRDDPDGWSELGFRWMDTSGLLERIKFTQRMTGNADSAITWNLTYRLASLFNRSAAGIVDHFNQSFLAGHITPQQRDVLIRFATTDAQGNPLPFDPARSDYTTRAQQLVALILSVPQWQNQ
jgi:hypothetical protein